MAQEQRKFSFDDKAKNQFTRELLNNTLLKGYIDKAINNLTDRYRDTRSEGYVSGYSGPTTEEDLEESLKHDKYDRNGITEALFELYKHPKSVESTKIVEYWEFINPIIYSNSSPQYDMKRKILVVLKTLHNFEPDVQLKLLRYIDNGLKTGQYNNIDTEATSKLRGDVKRLIASNSEATLDDKSSAAMYTKDINMVRDAVAKAEEELKKELNKEFPNSGRLSEICDLAKNAAEFTYDIPGYYKSVKEEFDLDKILEVGSEYVSQHQESEKEHVAKLEAQLADLQKDVEEKQRYINQQNVEIEHLHAKLHQAEEKTEKFANQSKELEEELRAKNALLKTIKMKAAALETTGILSRGKQIEEFNKFIKEEAAKTKVLIRD